MSLVLLSDFWTALKDHIDRSELDNAADSFVSLLIDNGFEPKEIREYFDDKPVLSALSYYAENDDLDNEDFEANEDEW